MTDNEILSVSRKLTMLEMKEINERQRADHAQSMYDKQRTALRQLEDRNIELEHKFAEVSLSFLFLSHISNHVEMTLYNSG